MEANGSYGTSWADQWDNDSAQHKTTGAGGGSTSAKYKAKVREGLGKTKAVASTGAKKVKEGTVVGFQWIKDKYHKATQKH